MTYIDLLKILLFAIVINWIVYLNIFAQMSSSFRIKKISYLLAIILGGLCGLVIFI